MAYQPDELHILTPAFRTQEIDEVMDTFYRKWIPIHQLRDNDILYHYTTPSGIKGILSSRSFRFGHVHYFNDPREIQYGKNLVKKLLNKFIEKEGKDDVGAFLRNLLLHVETFGEIDMNIFIFSLSKSSKIVGQWRAYADNGKGYCLGFKFPANIKFYNDLNDPQNDVYIAIRKVIYDESEQHNLVQEYIESIIVGTKKVIKKKTVEPIFHAAVMAIQAANILMDLTICFKHEAFKEEQEWRLIYVVRKDIKMETIKFRETKDGLVPYRQFQILNEDDSGDIHFPLCSVIIGPSLDPLKALTPTELLLNKIASDSHSIKIVPERIEIIDPGFRIR